MYGIDLIALNLLRKAFLSVFKHAPTHRIKIEWDLFEQEPVMYFCYEATIQQLLRNKDDYTFSNLLKSNNKGNYLINI